MGEKIGKYAVIERIDRGGMLFAKEAMRAAPTKPARR
jgi:hypothetical protein